MATAKTRPEPQLVVIVGPTASGKTALAIELAEQFGGEIICADSRTVYKGMDIGTAKPSSDERRRVPHWGLDLVNPGERFTAADFKQYAMSKIAEIRARGKIPFLVGGTGLYVDSVVFDFQFAGDVDIKLRQTLESMNLELLHKYCNENNIELPENVNNKRYVIRAIERQNINAIKKTLPIENSIIVGIATNRDELRQRIEARSEQIFENGVVEEATRLGKKYGWGSEAMTGNIYPLIKEYVRGELTQHELKQKFVVRDYRLAKRQMTWFRRNEYINWLTRDAAARYISSRLASE